MRHHLPLAFAGLAMAWCFLGSGDVFAQDPPTSAPTPPASAMVSGVQQVPNQNKPRVFLQASSGGNRWASKRDQAMEMSKDLEKDCPGIRVTLNQSNADYTVLLNHVEVGWSRDNQFQVANKDGDLITNTKEGGSINKGVKRACEIILDDWASNKKPQ